MEFPCNFHAGSYWLYAGFANLAYWWIISMIIPWNLYGISIEPPWNLHEIYINSPWNLHGTSTKITSIRRRHAIITFRHKK